MQVLCFDRRKYISTWMEKCKKFDTIFGKNFFTKKIQPVRNFFYL